MIQGRQFPTELAFCVVLPTVGDDSSALMEYLDILHGHLKLDNAQPPNARQWLRGSR